MHIVSAPFTVRADGNSTSDIDMAVFTSHSRGLRGDGSRRLPYRSTWPRPPPPPPPSPPPPNNKLGQNYRVIGKTRQRLNKKQRRRRKKLKRLNNKKRKRRGRKKRKRRGRKRNGKLRHFHHRIRKKKKRTKNGKRRRRKKKKHGAQKFNRFYRYDYRYSHYLSWLSFTGHEQRPHADSTGIGSGPACPDSNYYYRMSTSRSKDMCKRFHTMEKVTSFVRKRYSMPDYACQYSCYWRCKIYHECGRYPASSTGNEAYWEEYCGPMDRNWLQHCPPPERMPYYHKPNKDGTGGKDGKDGTPGAPVSFVTFSYACGTIVK